jgi:predicted phage tail protein
MLRKIKLYGELAKFVGHKEFEVKVETVAKAVSFLLYNFPGIEAHMGPKYYQVKVGDYDIGEDEVSYPVGQQDIHFIPVISGAGRGFGKILLGVALIGITIASGGGFGALKMFGGEGLAFAGGKFGAVLGSMAMNLGVGLTILGVSEMLFPLPEPQKFNSEEDPQLSFSFSGVQNTSRAGTPVPIVYGEIFTGSVVISAAIDTNQVEA